MRPASTGYSSTCLASAPGHGGATPTPNGGPHPETSTSSSSASNRSSPAPHASFAQAGGSSTRPARCCMEDEAQAEAFLVAEPEFSVVPAARAWSETIGGASPGGERYLRLTPAQHGTERLFVA